MSTQTRPVTEIESIANQQVVGLANGRVICHGCGEENEWTPGDQPETVTAYIEGNATGSYRVRALFCERCDVRTFRTQSYDEHTPGDRNVPDMKRDRDQILAVAKLLHAHGDTQLQGVRAIERAAPGEHATPIQSNLEDYGPST